MTVTPASGRFRRLGVVALATLPVVLAVAVDFPLCPTAGLFGVPCPGCGLTRATLAALQGDFAGALHHHPLVFLVAPVYIGVVVALGVSYVRGGSKGAPSRKVDRAVSVLAIAMFGLLFGVWLARFFGAFGGPVQVVTFGTWR